MAFFLLKISFFYEFMPPNLLYLTMKSSRAKEDGCADLPFSLKTR